MDTVGARRLLGGGATVGAESAVDVVLRGPSSRPRRSMLLEGGRRREREGGRKGGRDRGKEGGRERDGEGGRVGEREGGRGGG